MAGYFLGQEVYRVKVQINAHIPETIRIIVKIGKSTCAGVVDQNINASILLHALFHTSFLIIALRQVAAQEMDPAPFLFNERLDFGNIFGKMRDKQIRARLREGDGICMPSPWFAPVTIATLPSRRNQSMLKRSIGFAIEMNLLSFIVRGMRGDAMRAAQNAD